MPAFYVSIWPDLFTIIFLNNMPLILHIDTATPVCSVALTKDGLVIATRESSEKNAHSRVITIFIDEVLKAASSLPAQLDAIAVSMGPGSYTGLRIGVSTAKGLCYALDKPLIAVNTLQAMARGMAEKTVPTVNEPTDKLLFCPMIDARRMEVYAALFDRQNRMVRETRAEVIDEGAFENELKNHKIIIAGDGAEKCKSVLGDIENIRFLDGFEPSAKFMMAIAEAKFAKKELEDVAYFEPLYLKDFIAGMPKVKGLH